MGDYIIRNYIGINYTGNNYTIQISNNIIIKKLYRFNLIRRYYN